MAVLGSNFLNGCNSIPDFIASGYRMVFEQDNAPTSWTKETNAAYNNIALRVIGGANGTALSPGGSSPFTTIFSSAKGIDIGFLGPSNLQVAQATGFITLGSSPSGASVSGSTLTINQMRTHAHSYQFRGVGGVQIGPGANQNIYDIIVRDDDCFARGSDGVHGHPISDSTHNQHPVSTGAHTHTQTDIGHTHIFTMTQRDFNVQYMDVIICSKN